MSLRIKGQDCTLRLATADGPELSLIKVVSWEVTIKGEILKEEFTGETDPDYDSIADGVDISMEVQFTTRDALKFYDRVQAIRRREVDAAQKIIGVAKYDFPDGRVLGIIPELHFGDLPIAVKGRKGFVSASLKASGPRIGFKYL